MRRELILREYNAYWAEQTEAARKVAADHRTQALNPHHQRKPWLWGRSAWKATLVELEAVDSRNVAHWERLKLRRFTPEEVALAKKAVEEQARLKQPELFR